MRFLLVPLVLLDLCFLACAEEQDAVGNDPGTVLLIEAENIFATPEIIAASGENLVVINHDNSPHTVTSQSAPGAFDESGAFDIAIQSDGVQTFALPDAPPGTVFHYYCQFHLEGMFPDSGTITIE